MENNTMNTSWLIIKRYITAVMLSLCLCLNFTTSNSDAQCPTTEQASILSEEIAIAAQQQWATIAIATKIDNGNSSLWPNITNALSSGTIFSGSDLESAYDRLFGDGGISFFSLVQVLVRRVPNPSTDFVLIGGMSSIGKLPALVEGSFSTTPFASGEDRKWIVLLSDTPENSKANIDPVLPATINTLRSQGVLPPSYSHKYLADPRGLAVVIPDSQLPDPLQGDRVLCESQLAILRQKIKNYNIRLADSCPDDPQKLEPGVCGCGLVEEDQDGDGFKDCVDECPTDFLKSDEGFCGCGESEIDSDFDATPDCKDNCPYDSNKLEPAVCGCGEPETPGCQPEEE
jgi:hypothetical protein